jgi:hypothetical protein
MSLRQLLVTFSKQEPCPRPECYKCTNVRRDIKMKNDGHGFCLGLWAVVICKLDSVVR